MRSPFFLGSRFTNKHRFLWFSGLFGRVGLWMPLLALAVGCLGAVNSTRAAPPTEQELAAAFNWVIDEPTAEVAIELIATVPDPQTQLSMQDFVLITLLAKGGDPWKINPDWVVPVGP